MNKTITGILIGLFLLSLGYAIFLHSFKVPDLRDEITRLENLPPVIETEYIQGEPDSVLVIDTLYVNRPETDDPVPDPAPLNATNSFIERLSFNSPDTVNYTTNFRDSLLTGRVYNTVIGNGYLANTDVEYRFRKPIYTTQRVDSVIVTETKTIVKFKPEPKNFRVQVGVFAGAYPQDNNFYFGPTLGFLNTKDDWFGYSYDPINNGHFVNYRTTIRFDFIKNIDLNPFR